MDHPIDPKTDCVFKALLGAEDNRDLLIHFLNAILGRDLPSPVTQVDILNPYNEREFVTDKLSIVDVKARDDHARLYQAEIQLAVVGCERIAQRHFEATAQHAERIETVAVCDDHPGALDQAVATTGAAGF